MNSGSLFSALWMVGFVGVGALAMYFRASALKHQARAAYLEQRAQSAEAQADALAQIVLARPAGNVELEKMDQILDMGLRHQPVAKP